MKIDPNSLDRSNRIDSTGPAARTDKTFKDALAAKAGQTSKAADAQPLAGVAQSYTKADLADPAKADAIVDHAVREIMDREFGNMRTPDREQVAAWLRADPVMREAMLKHIRSLAS